MRSGDRGFSVGASSPKTEIDVPVIAEIDSGFSYSFGDTLEGYLEEAARITSPLSRGARPNASNVFFTSYNPEVGQTDASPCTGASGQDQCALSYTGVRMIALSQDLVGRLGNKQFTYGDTAWLEQIDGDDPRCNGEFIVLDTMNKRYTNRGDLFMMTRATNTSCTANVFKI